jgi:hypothetical protein
MSDPIDKTLASSRPMISLEEMVKDTWIVVWDAEDRRWTVKTEHRFFDTCDYAYKSLRLKKGRRPRHCHVASVPTPAIGDVIATAHNIDLVRDDREAVAKILRDAVEERIETLVTGLRLNGA